MEINITARGEIVERQELLNGTRTVAFEGTSDDGVWSVSGVVSWNLGLVDYAGEGDLTLVRDDGSELYATLTQASPDTAEDADTDASLSVTYEIDGGSGDFDSLNGPIHGRVRVTDDEFEAEWRIGPIPDAT